MLYAPALAAPARDLCAYLQAGGLLTPLAEDMSGQDVDADVERAGPLILYREEARLLRIPEPGLAGTSNWAALRRAGRLVQADGTQVARVTSVVALSRVTPGTVRLLQGTRTPLGKAIPDARSEVLWCTVGITEYAVACGRRILQGDRPVAVTTDWVLWSWLDRYPSRVSRNGIRVTG